MSMYKNKDSLDKTYKPLILKWLAHQFGYKDYPHSFKDQWLNWGIWDGMLTVMFDTRQEEQVKLRKLIPAQFMGIPQYRTLKIVNESTFYLPISKLIHIKYPKIVKSKLINKTKNIDNDGDTFYTYDWEVFLSDDTSIHYHNQKDIMDMTEGCLNYSYRIQERAFTEFLTAQSYTE